ncbi:MAG: hypothetical protein IH624_06835 [Phycisphaerae bacterium]|nr:hypothetical protein [Phycisphaerae bacterium]
MDTLKAIEELIQKLQIEDVPVFHVEDKVLWRLRTLEVQTYVPLSQKIFWFASAAAASVAAYVSIGAWKYITSPLHEFYSPLQEIRLW